MGFGSVFYLEMPSPLGERFWHPSPLCVIGEMAQGSLESPLIESSRRYQKRWGLGLSYLPHVHLLQNDTANFLTLSMSPSFVPMGQQSKWIVSVPLRKSLNPLTALFLQFLLNSWWENEKGNSLIEMKGIPIIWYVSALIDNKSKIAHLITATESSGLSLNTPKKAWKTTQGRVICSHYG